jgi:hypothetical protein
MTAAPTTPEIANDAQRGSHSLDRLVRHVRILTAQLDECRKMRNDLIKQLGRPGGVESAHLGRRADLSHSGEYEAGVLAACEWLERQTLTEDEQREGISWGRTCPETFAWVIRKWLLPNSELSSERAAEPQQQTGADARRLLK